MVLTSQLCQPETSSKSSERHDIFLPLLHPQPSLKETLKKKKKKKKINATLLPNYQKTIIISSSSMHNHNGPPRPDPHGHSLKAAVQVNLGLQVRMYNLAQFSLRPSFRFYAPRKSSNPWALAPPRKRRLCFYNPSLGWSWLHFQNCSSCWSKWAARNEAQYQILSSTSRL